MSRLIPLPVHSALEVALGTAVMAAPFVFGLGAASLVTGFVVGAVIVGLGISSASGSAGERGAISVSAHAAYDGGIAIGLIGAGIMLGIAGDLGGLLLLTGAGVLQTALTATTRYSAPARA